MVLCADIDVNADAFAAIVCVNVWFQLPNATNSKCLRIITLCKCVALVYSGWAQRRESKYSLLAWISCCWSLVNTYYHLDVCRAAFIDACWNRFCLLGASWCTLVGSYWSMFHCHFCRLCALIWKTKRVCLRAILESLVLWLTD